MQVKLTSYVILYESIHVSIDYFNEGLKQSLNSVKYRMIAVTSIIRNTPNKY